MCQRKFQFKHPNPKQMILSFIKRREKSLRSVMIMQLDLTDQLRNFKKLGDEEFLISGREKN